MAARQNKKKSGGDDTPGRRSRQGNKKQPEASGPELAAIVGVGASAGGLEALEELFRNMPTETGIAFVVVTHLHPGHKSLLPELLAKVTELPVVAATDGLQVEADHIYIGPPGSQLSIQGGRLQRMEPDPDHAPKMPINYFLRSLALDQRERAICIILSGTGSDGTLGLQEIKAQAGMVMAEIPQSARYGGMPASAIATGLVDFTLAPAAMPEQLLHYIHAPKLSLSAADNAAPVMDTGSLSEIFSLLRRHAGHDFSSYKINTIQRRIARRMQVHQIDNLPAYIRYMQEKPDEIGTLFRELLINVTSFFRDPEAWDALRPALETLVSSRPAGTSLRVWVPGCSSGEEVYSIAILLDECMHASGRQLEIQIFGTDLDAWSIDKARAGLYPDSIVDDLTEERLHKYFTNEKGSYRIRRDIREMAIFAPQNAIKDPPFTQVDLISCRNLMIYLNADIQQKLLPIFHYALNPGGILFLGSSETIGPFSDLFDQLDKRWKLFRRRENNSIRPALPEFSSGVLADGARSDTRVGMRQIDRGLSIQRQIERALLARFVPASVIVNERGDIVYVHGRTGAYLEPSEGQPRNNILEMARQGLQLELAEALRRCTSANDEVECPDLSVSSNGSRLQVDLSVAKLNEPEALRDLLLVSFRPTMTAAAPDRGADESAQPEAGGYDVRIEQMERALRFMRETHQATLEELETSNEELESANEELQSTNEELQSSNEELETSKEEMQSLNEELTTVNAELQSKLEDLSRASDDMQNLLNSTKIATVFLDNELKIKRFTEQARELVMLRQEDVGRPIHELASKLQHEDLGADCRGVLRTLVFKETEVSTSDGAIYLMRIMPYRTARNAIDGLVITFVDISRLKQAQKSLRHMSEVFQDSADPVIILALNGEITDVNGQAERAYGYTRDQLLGRSLQKLSLPGTADQATDLINRCRDGESIRNIPWTLLGQSGNEIPVTLSITVLTTENGDVDALALIARSATATE